MIWTRLRAAWLAGAVLAATALAGCENMGADGVDAELARNRGQKGFAIISSTAERATFNARGQRIVVEPPQGYCLDEGSVTVTRKSAFALVSDCMDNGGPELAENAGKGNVVKFAPPRSFPGIMTVSVSGEPAYGSEPGALNAFEALLDTPAGLTLLGRGSSPELGKVIAVRRIGGALYVLVEEPPGGRGAFLAPRFWRAFIDINNRLVLVTVSSFSDSPIADDAMMGFLALQMTGLRRANSLGTDSEEDEIASDFAARQGSVGWQGDLVAIQAVMSKKTDPKRSPVPLQRGQVASIGGGSGGGTHAPSHAPDPPRRPG
jgi:hypothetical protein